ncbi:MAG: alpha,alpha-phosphotrehalase [Lachnospiraceae bacterium]|nr:alpha,alpha-phosphotrehalase [Lachnospiraceae bacterium]
MLDFRNKVVYQIYPKSFRDSDGDGMGDLRGITEKLDYLKELGITYIWMTPFFVSPQRDNGYDIADYLQVDARFGTMEDLVELIEEGRKRGIGIMLDMVFNHTSTEHFWFQRALQGEEKYQNYYIFKDGTPNQIPTNWISKFGGPAWKYVPNLKKWYLHLFDETQADVNWKNPQVREELKKVILFWKEKGIQGFRFDVVNLISKPDKMEDDFIEDGRRFYTDREEVHAYLKELVRDTDIGEMVTVGELSSTSLENGTRYSNPEEKELSMCFNFHHLKVDYLDGDKWKLKKPDIQELRCILEKWQIGMQQKNSWNAVFWCNHDQPRIVSRFGDDKAYWKESAKMLATCIHMLRGTPYIYQGEEIGMMNAYYKKSDDYQDVESKNYYKILRNQDKSDGEALEILAARSRDNSRTAMQWDKSEFAGFSECTPWIPMPSQGKQANVQEEELDADSILAYYKKLIHLRKENALIAEGNIRFLMLEDPDVIAYIRYMQEKQQNKEELLILNNFSSREITLPMDAYEMFQKKLIGNYQKDGMNGIQDGKINLKPYETIVLSNIP